MDEKAFYCTFITRCTSRGSMRKRGSLREKQIPRRCAPPHDNLLKRISRLLRTARLSGTILQGILPFTLLLALSAFLFFRAASASYVRHVLSFHPCLRRQIRRSNQPLGRLPHPSASLIIKGEGVGEHGRRQKALL